MVSRAWYNQRAFLRKVFNRYVNDYFTDVTAVDDALGTSTSREEVKSACFIRSTDSQNMALLKVMTFYYVVQRVQFKPQFWGLPIQTFIDQLRHKAQIILHFKESRVTAYNNDRVPITSQVAFRIFDTDFTSSKVEALATTIRDYFANPVFSYTKGTRLYTYKDYARGYNFRLFTNTETDARNVISQVMTASNNDTPDFTNYLKYHQDNKDYTTEQYETILGESVRLPRKRPTGEVYFQYAELVIPDYGKTITLVDRSGQRLDPVLVA